MDNKTANSIQQSAPFWAPWLNWRRKRFWLLVALLSYTLLGFFAAPALIRWAAESNIEKAGRTVAIEEIRVNPFLLTITMNGVEVRDSDDTVILAYDEYFWNFQSSSLFRWAWTFKEIRLLGLYLHEERFQELDTRFTRLIEAFSPEEGTPTSVEESSNGLPRIIIGKLILRDGRLAFRDQAAGGFKGEFGPINVEIDDLRTLPDHSGQQSVSIRTQAGGHIEWRGTLSAVPFASEGHVSITGKGLDDAFRYAEHFLPFAVSGDAVEIELDYRLGERGDGFFAAVSALNASGIGAAIRPHDSDQETLRIGLLSIEDGALNWPEQTGRIERISVEEAHLRAGLLPDGSIDLLALVPELPEEDPAAPPSAPWVLEIGAIEIPAAGVELTDATLEPPLELALEPINLKLTGIDNRDGTAIPLELDLQLSTGGRVTYGGTVQAFPDLATQGQLGLEGVQLAIAQRYLEPFVRIEIEDGALDLEADLQHGPELLARLEGRMNVDNLLIHDTLQDERLIAWNRLAVDRFEADASALKLVTSTLEFEGLFGRLHIAEDLSTNVSDLLVEQGDAETTEEAEMPDLQIGGVQLENARMDFSDFSLPLPFRTNIQNLNGTVSTLSTTSTEPATVAMEGQVNEYGQARIDGNLNPWAPTELANIDMVFRNLDLSRLTPYTVQFAGYAIDDGRMDLDLGYRLDQRKLNGDNNVVIRDIVLGEKVEHPDAGSLPLGLAIALLTDANGVIDLDLPVEGDLDNPEFGIGSVVWQALGNLITKAVTAPFRLLGALVGIDSEDFGTLHFAAGSAELSPPDQEQMLKLAEAMQQRPELTVEVGGTYDARADTAALQTQALEAVFEERAAAMPIGKEEISTDHERRVLEAIAGERAPALDLAALQTGHTTPATESAPAALDLPAYLANLQAQLQATFDISEADLVALADARALAALSALRGTAPEAPLKAEQAEAKSIEAEDTREIPLELSVSAGR